MLHECLLHRILENLLTNAFRYTSPEGRIQLNIRRELSLLLMEITDTGIGIGKEDLKLIFNPFHRGRNVEGRRGLGMGLSIVQENLTLLHGTITVSSSVQTGSTFLVKIPVDASSNASESDQLLEVMKRDT
jgi:signal transduction histidine kinase